MIEEILTLIDKALHKERYLDTHLQNIISNATGFKASKIKLIRAYKSNDKALMLDTFNFKYEGLEYLLEKDKLTLIG